MDKDENIKKSMDLDLNNLAPISVSVYTRLEHFRQCIESLAANTLAKHSVLYVFSDAAKPGDEEAVSQVREYAKSIAGFKRVILYFQETNGYEKNMKDARNIPMNKNGMLIQLEDDIVVSKYFLEFLNEGLILYRDQQKVRAICGYTHPGFISKKREQIFSRSGSAWGVGLWAHKNDIDNINAVKLMSDAFKSWSLFNRIASGHPHLPAMMLAIKKGKSAYGDVIRTVSLYKNNWMTVSPEISLATNIGMDGSGVNCGIDDSYIGPTVTDEKIVYNYRKPIHLDREYQKHISKLFYRRWAPIKNWLLFFLSPN